MKKDTGWKEYLSDNNRYADLINGLGCGGRQVITGKDLSERDTQTGIFAETDVTAGSRKKAGKRRNQGARDIIRKAAFGMNFAVIGIESQELEDYGIPLRNLSYDVSEYEKQAAAIRRETRKDSRDLTAGEYLYGFRKGSRLCPVLTFILYTGATPWKGPLCLHDMIDFTDIPAELRGRVPDYEINLIEIRKFKDTGVFRTDVKQVFDFIRKAEDKAALKELVEQDAYYKNMAGDAFDLIVRYANAAELAAKKNYHKTEGGCINMCKAIRELMEDSRQEGAKEGWEEGRREGMKEGREEGAYKMLYDLVENNTLTMEAAASQKNLTVNEFRIKLKDFNII